MTTTPGPLDGLVVADLSRVLAGPYCSMLLADLGATVIKVESAAGDDTRSWTPPELDGVATYYLSINRNKHSIVLDYTNPDDVKIVHELFRRADIVIENFKVGGLAKFGLDYASAQAINPALIYLSISGFGTAGGAGLPGYDLVVQAVSGLMSLTGEPDGPPYRAGISVFDVMTGMHGTIGVLAALAHRNATGEGQHVEVNLLASALSGLVNHSGAFAAAGEVPFRMGNAQPSVYPYQPMPTADRDVIIAVGNDRQFRSFCRVLGLDALAEDDRFRLNADRTANCGELHPMLLDALSTWPADDLFLQLNGAGVPCGPINTIAEGVGLAERLGLDPIVDVGEQGIGLIRNPITMSLTAPRYDLAPPALGQDTASVLACTYLSAPDSIQGAFAAGLLGGGSRFLGVTEDSARFLDAALGDLDTYPTDDAGWDGVARSVVGATRAAGRFVPGLGHPVHKDGDPRTPVLMDLARSNDQFGPHLELFSAIGRVHPEVLGRSLPLNGAGVCGAVLADIDLPLGVMRGFALLARCAGLLGHLAEEMVDPVANDMYMSIDRNTDCVPPPRGDRS